MKLLQVALQRRDFSLAAHCLVYGLAKVRAEELRKGKKKKGRSTPKPKR